MVVAVSDSDGGGTDGFELQSITNRIVPRVAEARWGTPACTCRVPVRRDSRGCDAREPDVLARPAHPAQARRGAARLRQWVMPTDPTPGLPFIAAAGADAARLGATLAEAIAGLDAGTRATLGIVGYAALSPEDYGVIAERLAVAEASLPREAARVTRA